MTPNEFIQKALALGIPLEKKEEGLYVIHSFYFGKHYGRECEVYVEEEDFNLRSEKGFWVPLKEPAEIITYNYYEYYTPESNKGYTLEIPSFWEELYALVGLNEANEEFKGARRRTLLKKIEEHFTNESGLKDMSFWEQVSKEFPECLYTGAAYRAILVGPDDFNDKLLGKSGYSWALSLDGIKEFIENGDTYPSEDPGFYLVKGTIHGISLVHIQKLFPDVFFDAISEGSIFNEEEIILLELISTEKKVFIKNKSSVNEF